MKISNRLKKVALNVTPGYRVADIGTDHGYVPIYLMEHHLAQHVIAMDINEGPLSRARENIENCHLEAYIETRLSNGFENLMPGEADIAVISGMGGELMKNILKNGKHVIGDFNELVLSPHSEIYVVREYVKCIGHKIVNEEMFVDEGKYYTIIKTSVCNHKEGMDNDNPDREYSDIEYKYGAILLERKDEVLWDFLKRKRDKYLKILRNFDITDENINNIKKSDFTEKSVDRYIQIKKEIEEIEGILKR